MNRWMGTGGGRRGEEGQTRIKMEGRHGDRHTYRCRDSSTAGWSTDCTNHPSHAPSLHTRTHHGLLQQPAAAAAAERTLHTHLPRPAAADPVVEAEAEEANAAAPRGAVPVSHPAAAPAEAARIGAVARPRKAVLERASSMVVAVASSSGSDVVVGRRWRRVGTMGLWVCRGAAIAYLRVSAG